MPEPLADLVEQARRADGRGLSCEVSGTLRLWNPRVTINDDPWAIATIMIAGSPLDVLLFPRAHARLVRVPSLGSQVTVTGELRAHDNGYELVARTLVETPVSGP